jgi:DNA invertase Pin-like site-specific DNA recombinase
MASSSAFLAAVKANKVPRGSYLLVESLDRVSRADPYKSLPIILDLVAAGINVVTLTNGRVFNAEKRDPMDIMFSLVELMRAYDESEKKRDRTTKNWAYKRSNASSRRLTSICPGWLKPKGDGFEVIKEHATTVRRIFESSASGLGNFVITKNLNENRVPLFGKGWDNKQGHRSWHQGTVNRILNNRAVLGENQLHRRVDGKRIPDGDVVKGYYPAIISEELFFRAQAARAQRMNHELKSRSIRVTSNTSPAFNASIAF